MGGVIKTEAVFNLAQFVGPEAFREGTKDHDVSQNVEALLRHLPDQGSHRILDLGCGPGRDLATFKALGHDPVGLDGAAAFVDMARAATGCEVWHQDFLGLELPAQRRPTASFSVTRIGHQHRG